jgi:hypothetical protein
MAGYVEIALGDMFEGPSDLVVLPCSELPTISDFVSKKLEMFGIPKPNSPMRLGEVRFLPLSNAEQVAPIAAYAASVKTGYGSEVSAIERIGRTIGTYAEQHRRITLIAAPLLGSEAGGLEPSDAFKALKQGFLATAPAWATLRVYVFDPDRYERIRSEHSAKVRDAAPRVFISYTKTNKEHAEWVQKLAEYLLANGVEARLDVWDLSPGMDVAQWMTNELDMAERALLISNEEYARRADRLHGGVGWEIRLVQGDLLFSQAQNPDKYIPIVRAEDLNKGTPSFLKSTFFLSWSDKDDAGEEQREDNRRADLLREIFRIRTKPQLGSPPDFIVEALRA